VGADQPAGRFQTGAEPLIARVAVDVPAIDREFDYLVPDKFAGAARVGTIVRVALHGRRVRGWITALGSEPAPGVELQPIAKITGFGPPTDLIDLATWAAWRWAGRRTSFLRAASPDRAISGLPSRPRRAEGALESQPPAAVVTPEPLAEAALGNDRCVLRLPPAGDRFPVIAAALRRGPALVLTASTSDAVHLAQRLRRAGHPVALLPHDWAQAAAGGSTVVGTRAAAWAPAPDFASVLVLDAHDDAHVEERAPTWNAWAVGAERAARAGVPCVAVTPTPTLELLAWGDLITPSRAEERNGWPPLEVVDRREDDPRRGLYSERIVPLLRSGERVLCILNRKGRATLLACAACGELTRCEHCDGPMSQSEGVLRCRRCGQSRPALCNHCGGQRLKQLRIGVTRVREELEALAGTPVGEVTADTEAVPDTAVIVGTEALLHRVPKAHGVVFLDFDQELLAPRYTASESALGLLARAGRIVGGRRRGGRVIVQTRVPDHEVIAAALHADPALATDPDAPRRRALGLPPFGAMALVSGEAAAKFVAGVTGIEPRGPVDGVWQLRAPDHITLCNALASATRPPGRLRVEVDPRRA
jgi:primosomal protein N' (replication factor Y)